MTEPKFTADFAGGIEKDGWGLIKVAVEEFKAGMWQLYVNAGMPYGDHETGWCRWMQEMEGTQEAHNASKR